MMDPRLAIIDKRLQPIKRIIAVASGKGGVGKSLVASTLALLLSERGYKVGLLDLDLYGPSSHVILGVHKQFPKEDKGIIPPRVNGVEFMTIAFFAEDEPIPIRGEDVTNAIIELLTITRWSDLDFLVVDMPPGSGDEVLDTIRFMKRSEFLVVSTPSKVAISTVERLIKLLTEIKVPILGVIENMKLIDSNLVSQSAKKYNVKYLGAVPFDYDLENAIGNPDQLLKTNFAKTLKQIIFENLKL